MKKSLAIIALALACTTLFAQNIPVVEAPRSVSADECLLKSYDLDPNASAVILWENCTEFIDHDMMRGYAVSRTSVTRRIKIFRSSAGHHANLVMSLNDDQSLKDVSLTTYNIEKGEIKTYSTSKNDLVKTRLNSDSQQYACYAKNVRAGSVVEISYTLVSPLVDGPHLFDFQRSIPVNLVNYSIKLPSFMKARKSISGLAEIDFKLVSSSDGEPFECYRVADLPAFKEEPMNYCPDQYISSVRYEFSRASAYAESWSEVAKMLKESLAVTQLHYRTPIRKAVREIAAQEADDKTKITNIMALVFSRVKWNHELGAIPYPLDEFINWGFGNSADINSFMGAALTEAGYTVTPVFIKLRSDGYILPHCPSPDAFGTFILHIRRPDAEDGIDAFLDASNTNLYFNVLPDEFLVDTAFEVNNDGSFNWLDLTKLSRNVSTWSTIASLGSDGSMQADMTANFYNTSSFNFKDTYGACGDSLIVRKMMDLIDCDTISSVELNGFGSFYPASNMGVTYRKQCQVGEDSTITLNPINVNLIQESVFRPEERRLPLDFSYPENVDYSFVVKIPKDYEVTELPEPLSIAAGVAPLSFLLRCQIDNNPDDPSVIIRFRFNNEALTITPEQYPVVRELWQRASAALANARIVLKKKD